MNSGEYGKIAGVVVQNDDGQYLMVQERQPKAYGLWGIPGGHVDEGETPQQAAIREAKEEVGLEVELISNKPLFFEHNDVKKLDFHGFAANLISGTLSPLKEELLDARWLTFEEIRKLNDAGKIRSSWIFESVRKAEKR